MVVQEVRGSTMSSAPAFQCLAVTSPVDHLRSTVLSMVAVAASLSSCMIAISIMAWMSIAYQNLNLIVTAVVVTVAAVDAAITIVIVMAMTTKLSAPLDTPTTSGTIGVRGINLSSVTLLDSQPSEQGNIMLSSLN